MRDCNQKIVSKGFYVDWRKSDWELLHYFSLTKNEFINFFINSSTFFHAQPTSGYNTFRFISLIG